MNQIKDYYKQVTSPTPQTHEKITVLKSVPDEISYAADLEKGFCEEKEISPNHGGSIRGIILPGDILVRRMRPQSTFLVKTVPQDTIMVGPGWIILRELDTNRGTLPKWAVVHIIRLHHNRWSNTSMMGQALARDILEFRMEPIPEANPKGEQILTNVENLIRLKKQQIELMEKLHEGIAYRMLKNKPLNEVATALTIPC